MYFGSERGTYSSPFYAPTRKAKIEITLQRLLWIVILDKLSKYFLFHIDWTLMVAMSTENGQ